MLVPTTQVLVWAVIAELAVYLTTSVMLIATRLRHERRIGLLERLQMLLRASPGSPSASDADRRLAFDLTTLAPLADIRILASDVHLSRPMMTVLAQSLLVRLGAARVREHARSRRSWGRSWRQIVALRTLAFAGGDQVWAYLSPALASGSYEVKAVAVTLLGQLGDRRSATLLVEALRTGSFARSRISASLEAFPLEVGDLIAPLLSSDDAQVRFWATTLMRRYPATPGLVRRLADLTCDPEPSVRKAAIDSIVATATLAASDALRIRLADDTPFVRAHAVRALGRLHGASLAAALVSLLADRDWTVRHAAKETLMMMGEGSAAAVFPFLSHADEFARNGAAEVLQNLGVFERLVALEAAGPSQPGRARQIRLMAGAGGARMAAGVVQRLNADIRVRARRLLAPAVYDGPLVGEVA